MADPNSPKPPAPTQADRLTGQLVHLPPARPFDRPLPDAAAIRQIAVPHADPPYDLADDTVTLDPLEPIPAAQEAFTWPTDEASPPGAAPTGASPAEAEQAPEATHFGERYSAGPWPSQFAQALAEILAGIRPQSQLAPWISVQARRRIRQLGPTLATASQPKLKRVIITSPAGGVLEMTVVVDLGARIRALAVRLERSDTPAPPTTSPARPTRPAPANRTSPTIPTRSADPAEPRWRCTAIEAA